MPVDPDRRPVPVEHRPLHPPAPAPHRDARERPQERPAAATAALGRRDEEVFEIERRTRQERRVREEVEGEADRPAAPAADEGLEVAAGAEAITPDPGRGGDALVREALVLRQATDQRQDRRDVAPGARADRQAGGGHVRLRPRPAASRCRRAPRRGCCRARAARRCRGCAASPRRPPRTGSSRSRAVRARGRPSCR